jgi:hypothetical protein
MRISLPMMGLVVSAYFSMGDGGCSTYQTDNRTFNFYHQDVCGSKSPFYWKADQKGRKFRITLKVNTQSEIFQEGTYSEPILLPCPDSTDAIYIVYEIHD